MSCQSTPISTRWTTTTSNVPATSTTVLTSIITPKPSISTSLLTSCLSTRPILPTAGLHVSTKRTKNESSSDADPNSSSAEGINEDLVLSTTKERHRERFSIQERQVQVPSGLPSDCVSWTIKPVLSTIAPSLSTSSSTNTVVTTTATTIWVPGETIWGGCESSVSGASSSGGSSVVSSSSTPADTSSTTATSSSSGPETASPASSSTESTSTDSASSSTQIPSSSFEVTSSPSFSGTSTSDTSSSTKQWLDETTKLNSMASVLSAEGTTFSNIISATLLPNATALAATTSSTESAIAITSDVPIAPIVVMTPSSSSTSSSRKTTSSDTSTADFGAATQGAMAVDDGRNKAVSVGATIGGIIGLLGLIALILMGVRFYMRWKRGNQRKTVLMRQSWYPGGYDGPDHMIPDPPEKDQDPSHFSFFSMNGKNAIAGGTGGGSQRKSKRFPGLNVPHIPTFFPYSKNNRDVLDDHDQDFSENDAKPLTMPAIFAGMKPNKVFPALWSPRTKPDSPPWEKYVDEPIYDGSQSQPNRNRDVNPPRSIMTRPPGFDGVVGPPKLDYQPAQGHMSWGLQRPSVGPGGMGKKSRPNLEWGHSYAASTINPNPRNSVMPPLPPSSLNRPFIPGPLVPPSPTEESVYSKCDSHHSGRESRQSRQSKQSFHSHRNRQSGTSNLNPNSNPVGLNRKPSRNFNPDLRSAILSRASASAASLGHWSLLIGTSDHSIPALPEGGLRFDFPLPPTPSTRAPTMVSVPPPPPPKPAQGNRALVPQRRPSDRKPAPNISSVFEYADYTRESTAGPVSVGGEGQRDTIRQTANWYEKPLWVWDGQSGPLPRIPTDHGMLDGSDFRQSQTQGQARRSVKFDPADGVARAL